MSQVNTRISRTAKASRGHGKRGQLVTTNIDTAEDSSTTDTNTVYSPNWPIETAYYNKYVAEDGIGYREANRHMGALKAAITKKYGDLELRAQLLASVSPESAKELLYFNPWSKLMWLGAALNGFKDLNPKAPFYVITLLADAWNRSTADEGNGTAQVKKLVKELLAGIEAHSFGHVETAVFPRNKIDGDGYHSAVHAQVIVWGVSANVLRKALKPHFPPLEDGTKGYWVLPMTHDFAHVLSYATKSPAYGNSVWSMTDGKRRHNSERLSQIAHDQLLKQFDGTTWPAVNIATGDGKTIRKSAVNEIGYKPSKDKSPLADKLETAVETPPPALTLETDVDPGLRIDAGERKLPSMAAEVSVDLGKSLGQEEKSRERLYGSLEGVYKFALTSADRKRELKAVLKSKRITFNRAADLFLLAVKIATARQDVPKQRISEWAGALRYLYSKRCEPDAVATKLKDYGPKECAKALRSGKTPKEGKPPKESRTTDLTDKAAWTLIRKHGTGFEVRGANTLEMPVGKGVLMAARHKDENKLFVRHLVGSNNKLAREFLQKVANDLTAKSAKEKKVAS